MKTLERRRKFNYSQIGKKLQDFLAVQRNILWGKKENMIKKHDDRDEKFNSHDER